MAASPLTFSALSRALASATPIPMTSTSQTADVLSVSGNVTVNAILALL